MVEEFNVFGHNHNLPEWIGCAATLDDCLRLIRLSCWHRPGLYLVVQNKTKVKMYYDATRDCQITLLPTSKLNPEL